MRTLAVMTAGVLSASAPVRRAWMSRPIQQATAAVATAVLAAALCGLAVHPVDAAAEDLVVPTTPPAAEPVVERGVQSSSRPASQATNAPERKLQRASSTPARDRDAPNSERDTGPVERLVWDRAPLLVPLGVGADFERSITFPAPMHLGVPQEIAPLLRIQTVGRTSYVTALAPFSRTRILAEDRAAGSVVLLDLVASKHTTSTLPVSIVAAPAHEAQPADNGTVGDEGRQPIDAVTLTRYAAQQLYAPRRLTGARPGIRRMTVDTSPLDDLYAGGAVHSTPAAQWRGDDLYVTAVVLRNLRSQPIELNPLDVRGRWRAITFQHGRLLARGAEADTTVVYLVCERPFDACR